MEQSNSPNSIKEAFSKVKDDINKLNLEISEIKKEVETIKSSSLKLIELVNKLNNILKIQLQYTNQQTDKPTDRQTNQQTDKQTNRQTNQKDNLIFTPTHSSTDTPTHSNQNPTFQHINPTEKTTPTHSSTDNSHFKGLKDQFYEISTGNRGVPTDRQTDQQTDRQTHNLTQNSLQNAYQTTLTPSVILSQLDSIKKEIRLKIKRLTPQEMLIFSSIYQFEDQGDIIDYPFLSQRLNLSESSIRDYTQRIINKGIPIIKEKINNKRIILHISPDLKKLATLNTLISLRNL